MKKISDSSLVWLLGALVAIGPLAIDLYLPTLPTIARDLAVTAEAVQLSITVFLAGFALGMLFYGPMSDRYGRRPVILTGLALFVCASLACLLAQSVQQLIVARFVQALGGGAAAALARAVVRDVYPPAQAIRKLSLMAMVTTIAPLLAPLLGSALLLWLGWRGTFGAVLVFGCISCALVWRYLPETLPASMRGHMTLGAAFAAYVRLLMDPAAVGLLLTGGMSFAALFSYITASSFYFIELQHWSPVAYSVLFASNALGILLTNYLNSVLVKSRGAVMMAGIGSAFACAGATLLCLGVMWGDVLPAVLLGLFIVTSMTGLLGANCVGLLMARYPQNAGAAAALFGACQFGFGMCASAAVSYFHDGSGKSMAGVIWVVTVISGCGYGLFRYKWGKLQ